MRSLANAVVVLTGASSGIGRAAAHAFARRGATLVLAARRGDVLEEVVRECRELGGQAVAVPTDTTDPNAVTRLANEAAARFGRIDVWVNDAAVTMFGRIDEAPLESFRRVIETNLFGYVHGARAALPYFRRQGHGVLINVASVAGKIGQPYTSAYCASKFAVVGLSESIRQELMLHDPGLHVCTVLPATIDTPIFQHAANYTGRAAQAMPPVYQPEDVAAAIVECAERPQREVFVGGAGRRLVAEKDVVPGTMEWQMAKKVDRDHLLHRPAPTSDGNLFAPSPGPGSVHGGWSRGSGSGLGSTLLAGAAIVAGAALLAGWLASRQGSAGGDGRDTTNRGATTGASAGGA